MRGPNGTPATALLIATLLLMTIPAGTALAEHASPQQPANLLTNPGFEGHYVEWDPIGNVKVAPGWTPWYVEGNQDEQLAGYGRVAEFFPATHEFDSGRILEGDRAQGLKHDFGTGKGGIYQQVTVPADTVVRFSVWGWGYSCQPNPGWDCPNTSTMNPSDLRMQIGVDPTGGTNFDAASVIASPPTNAYDAYQEFVVEADTGSSTQVTVFITYYPEWPVERNKVYWDKASLTALGQVLGAPVPTPTPTPTPTPQTPAVAPPPPVEPATGPAPVIGVMPEVPESTYTTRPGDTLVKIAQITGTPVNDLINLNGPTYPGLFSNPDLIGVGWVFKLLGGTTPSALPPVPTGPERTYIVQPGDTLGKIAQDTGTAVSALITLNGATYPSLKTEPDVLYVGWVLRLP